MENQVAQGMEDLLESRVVLGRMENQVVQALAAHRVGRVVPVEADLILKCTEDRRAK
jgi:hypothetical protein